jgi:hypothetical protein
LTAHIVLLYYYVMKGMLCLGLFTVSLALGCVVETRLVGPGNPRSDGGIGGWGGAGGAGGAGGTAAAGGAGGVGGTNSLSDRLTCETCTSDDDCAHADHRCVEMSFAAKPFPDANTGFCLRVANVVSEEPIAEYDCEPPYVTVLLDRRSLSGGELEDYCGIREDLTTCLAVLAHQATLRCSSGGAGICPDGGFCDWVRTDGEPWQELCTYACDDPAECEGPGGQRCNEHCGF